MKVNILYFAQLAELAGRSEEVVELSDSSPQALYLILKERYGFPHDFEHIQVAINHELSAQPQKLNDGDTVTFLPPMTGG